MDSNGTRAGVAYAWSQAGADACVEVMRTYCPEGDIRVARTLVPNELGRLESAYVIFPFSFSRDVPY